MVIFHIKVLNEINSLVISIYIPGIQNCWLIPPRNFYGQMTFRMHCYWSTDQHNAIDHSSIGLKRVTMQSVVNRGWLWLTLLSCSKFSVSTSKCQRKTTRKEYSMSQQQMSIFNILNNIFFHTAHPGSLWKFIWTFVFFPFLVLDLTELDELDLLHLIAHGLVELTVHGWVKCSFALSMEQFTIQLIVKM